MWIGPHRKAQVLKGPTKLMLSLVTMKILLRSKCCQRPTVPGPVRVLHKDYRTVTPQNFSNYESMKKDFKLEIPEYFNFAKDVLDQWTNVEKVHRRASLHCPSGSDCVPREHVAMSGDHLIAMTWGRVWLVGRAIAEYPECTDQSPSHVILPAQVTSNLA